ncbi:MAG: phosphoribosyl-ATP diphosphatase [Henriciella sp.]|jgi:phosphoribosyl-ATP pyrophosphohydrolase
MSDNALGPATRLAEALAHLARTIDARAGASPETSYTARLLAGGPLTCAKKAGEEGVEFALAISSEGDDAIAAEASDLLYHALVALRARGIDLDTVADQLIARQGLSGLDEKAARTP